MPVKTDRRDEQGGHISTLNLRYTANGGSNSILRSLAVTLSASGL